MTDFVDTNALAYSGRALPAVRQAELVSRWGWWFQAERRLLGMKAYWTTIAGEAVLTPLLYLIAMGVGLGRLVDAGSGGVGGVSYLAFVGPGLLVASTVMTATGEFTYGVMDGFKWSKIYFARSATAASPWQVAVGELLAVGVRFLVQSLVFWLMLVGFGVAGWGSWPIALVASLAALAFGAPLMAFSAAQTDEGTQFTMIQRFVVAPMFLFAGTFFPLESMPVYLQWIGWISPMWHGTQVARLLAFGLPVPPWLVAVHLAFLVVLVGLGTFLTVRNFERRLQR